MYKIAGGCGTQSYLKEFKDQVEDLVIGTSSLSSDLVKSSERRPSGFFLLGLGEVWNTEVAMLGHMLGPKKERKSMFKKRNETKKNSLCWGKMRVCHILHYFTWNLCLCARNSRCASSWLLLLLAFGHLWKVENAAKNTSHDGDHFPTYFADAATGIHSSTELCLFGGGPNKWMKL